MLGRAPHLGEGDALTEQPAQRDVPYPDPRQQPWPGFALAASAAVEHLEELLALDLWLVTAVRDGAQTVVAAAGAWSPAAPPGGHLRVAGLVLHADGRAGGAGRRARRHRRPGLRRGRRRAA
jgi:hypothetical protein